jgi:DNA-binding IclR family transcriptional regulator
MKPVAANETTSSSRDGVEQSYTVASVKRALDVLDSFAERRTWSLTELSKHLGLNKSTVFRLVATLTEQGYLSRDTESENYHLGPQLVALGNATMEYEQLAWKAAPPLQQLSQRTGESVHVGVVHDGAMVNVQIVEGSHVIRMQMEVGRRRPAHASALGKMILAYAPEEQVDAYLWSPGLLRFTPNTITDPEAFKVHLRQARQKGWVLDDEELEIGLRCVAAPVYDARGVVFAALSVSGPSFRITDARVTEIRPLVQSTAAVVSRLMGYEPDAEPAPEGA